MSKDSKDRLIELLQLGLEPSISEELLADLSDDDLHEFNQARQAMRLLDMAHPGSMPLLDRNQQATETATMQDAQTATPAANIEAVCLPGIKNLGHYEVLETLGQGGFGIVVKARDTKLGRTVALKIPKLDTMLQGQEARDRFAREARLVAMLGHPAIVPVYETGSDGPLLFIASAYCNGGQLSRWFSSRDKNIAPTLSARIIARLAEAVQHAHSRGVVHRDLKPGNVLLDFEEGVSSPDEQSLVAALRITDFGLAKFLSDDQSVTRTGATIGTPAYMSPEQARGAVNEIGPAADIYALGAILYELLTGKPPIIGESNIATMRAIETQTPVPPRTVNPHISADLSAICSKCLEKDPRHRYASAQELQNELNSFLKGKPVQVRPLGPATRMARWSRRNPVVALALSVAFAALTIGLAVSIAYGVRANRATKLAIEKQHLADTKSAEALGQAKLARTAVDDLLSAIANEPSLTSRGMESFRKKLVASASNYYQLISTAQSDDEDVLREHIDTLQGLAYLHSQLGDHTTAEEILDRAIVLIETAFPNEILAASKMRIAQSKNVNTLGRHQEAIAMATVAVKKIENALQTGDAESLQTGLVKAKTQLAQSMSARGAITDADSVIDEAIEIVNEITGLPPQQWPADSNWGKVLNTKSVVSLLLLKHDELDKYAPMATRIFDDLMDDDPDRAVEWLTYMARCEGLLGTSLNRRQSLDLALEHLQVEGALLDQLLELRPEVASNHGLSANQRFRLARCLFDSGKVDEAQDAVLAYLPQLHATVQRFPELNALLKTNVLMQQLLAKTYRQQKDMEKAMEELARAIVICESVCQSPQAALNTKMILSTLYMEQSTFYLQQQLHGDAAGACRKGLDILEQLYQQQPAGQHVGQLAFAYMLYGNAMNKAGQYGEFLRVTDDRLDDWPHPSPHIRKAMVHRVDALIHVQQWERARQEFELLSSDAADNASLLDMAGLASKCAGVATDTGGTGGDDYQYFVSQSLGLVERVRDAGMLEDESVVNLLNEHPDFEALRQTDAFSEIIR